MTLRSMHVLALGLTLGASNVLAQQTTVKIGVLAPLTGNSAADGQEMVRGARLAVKELNAAGGVAGYKFEVVVGDTKDQTPDAVTSAVERILGDRAVHFVATGYASGSNFEINLMQRAQMPYMVSANSQQTRDIVAKAPNRYPTIWSLTPSYDAYETQVLPVLQNLEKQGKVKFPNKTLAIVSSDNPYSKSIFEGLKKSFKSAGWKITTEELLPYGEINNWRAFLAKVRRDPPDVLINTDYLPGNAASFMTQFLENPTNSLVFIQYAPSVPEFVNLTKNKSSGVLYNLLGGPIVTPSNPRAAQVIKKFTTEYKVEPGVYGVALYEQVNLYADALRKVKNPADHLAIGKALGETNKVTAYGRVRFDPKTHLAIEGSNGIPLQFYQLQQGKRVLFSPNSFANGQFILPPWMKK